MDRTGTPFALNSDGDSGRGGCTLRIEKGSRGGKTAIRLIGHFQLEHIGELRKQFQDNGPGFALDLTEVTLVEFSVGYWFAGKLLR
jgi:hypothetical protein